MQKILVVGGCGYIGSHMVKCLVEKGCHVTIFDNLSTGHADAVSPSTLIVGDLADKDLLDKTFVEGAFEVVMHFASSISVSESVDNPALYYQNNVTNTQNLLDTMIHHDVNSFIFSSTAAIFGEPKYIPIDESHPKQPINPYGRTKWIVEQMLGDYDKAYGLKSICLRYFNAAGADPGGALGERHSPETHLIPLILQASSGKRDSITVFGRDYDTTDGTCVRDYIHVTDLCEAHWLAIQYLSRNRHCDQFNLGNNRGFSVQEVINTARKITGKSITINEGARRNGDPAILVADSCKAQKVLGWTPQYHDLENIIKHAWQWELNNENIKNEPKVRTT